MLLSLHTLDNKTVIALPPCWRISGAEIKVRFPEHHAEVSRIVSFYGLSRLQNGGGGGFFLAREDFLRMFDNSFPACALKKKKKNLKGGD